MQNSYNARAYAREEGVIIHKLIIFLHYNLGAITRFTTFAISNKNLHHFFDGHSYLRVTFFPTTMKERVTFYVDGFKYTIPEEWDKKRKNLIDSLI